MCWQRGVPLGEIMYAEEELDVPLIQPLLFKPVLPEDQDPVSSQYPGVVTGHPALMNDLGTGPNHGHLQQAVILLTAGAKTDVLDFHVLDMTLRRGWRINQRGRLSSPRSRLSSEHQPVGVRPGPGGRGDPEVRHASNAAPSARRRCGRDQRGTQQPRRGRDDRPRARPLQGSGGSSAGSTGKVRYGPDAKAAVTPSGRVTWQGVAAGGTTRFPAARAGRPGQG